MNAFNSRDLPEPLRHKFNAVAAKMRAVGLARGVAVVVAVFILCMAFSFILDRFLVLSNLQRVLLLTGSLCASGLAACLYIARPMLRKQADDALAFSVETAHPELHESLASTVEIVESPDSQDLKGSPELIAALVEQTVARTLDMDFRSVVSLRTARRAICVAGVFLLAVAMYAAFRYQDFSHLFRRFLLADVPRVTNTRLRVGPGNDTILSGESITIYARATGKVPENAYLHYRPDNRGKEKVEMLADKSGTFVITMGNQHKPFNYRVRAGDAISPEYRVNVVARPEITSLLITCKYPRYTGKEAKTISGVDGAISELVGTGVTVKAKSSQPLEGAMFVLQSDEAHPRPMDVAGSEAAFSFTVTSSDVYSIKLVSKAGYENMPVPEYPIEAVPDRRPIVKIAVPGRNLSLPHATTVELRAAARDDYGLAKVELSYTLNDGEPRTVGLARPAAGDQSLVISHRWDLTAMALRPGDRIAYKVSAFDARGARGRGDSSEFLILIGLGDKTPARKEQMAALDGAGKKLHDLVVKMQADTDRINRLKQIARNEDTEWTQQDQEAIAEAVRKLDDTRKAAAEAADQLEQALARSDDKRLAADLAEVKRTLKHITEKKLDETQKQLERAADQQEQAERSDKIARAEQAAERAAQAVEKIAEQLDVITAEEKLKDIRQAAADIAGAQRELGQRLADQAPATPDKAEATARDQQLIAEAIGKTQDDTRELIEEMKADLPEAAGRLQEAHEQLTAAVESAQQAARAAENLERPQALEQMQAAEQELSHARRAMREAQGDLAGARREHGAALAELRPDLPAEARALAQRRQDTLHELGRALEAEEPDREAVEGALREQDEIAEEAKGLARLADQMAQDIARAPEPDFRAAQDFADAARAFIELVEAPVAETAELLREYGQDFDAVEQALDQQAEAAANLENIAENIEQLEAEHQLHEAAAEAVGLAQEQKELSQQALRTPDENLAATDDVADRQQELQDRAEQLANLLDDAQDGWQGQDEIYEAIERAAGRAAPIPEQMNQAQEMLAEDARAAAEQQYGIGRELEDLGRDLARTERAAQEYAAEPREELAEAAPALEDGLAEIIAAHEAAAQALEQAREQLDDGAPAPLTPAEAMPLDQAREQQANAQEMARDIAEELALQANAIGDRPQPDLDTMGRLDQTRAALNRVADGPMEQAREQLAEAMAADAPDTRDEHLAGAAQEQEEALGDLQDFADRALLVEPDQQLAHAAEQAAELHRAQETMAPLAAHAEADDEQNREVMAAAQQQSADRAQELARQAERLADALEPIAPEVAEQAREAAELAEPAREAIQQAAEELQQGDFDRALPHIREAAEDLGRIEHGLAEAATTAREIEPEQPQTAQDLPEERMRQDLAGLMDIAERQEDLARRTLEDGEDIPADPEAIAEEQALLAANLFERLAEIPLGREAALEHGHEMLEDLRGRAESLAEEQRELAGLEAIVPAGEEPGDQAAPPLPPEEIRPGKEGVEGAGAPPFEEAHGAQPPQAPAEEQPGAPAEGADGQEQQPGAQQGQQPGTEQPAGQDQPPAQDAAHHAQAAGERAEAQRDLQEDAARIARELADARAGMERIAPEAAEPLREIAEPRAQVAAQEMARAAEALEDDPAEAPELQARAAEDIAEAAGATQTAAAEAARMLNEARAEAPVEGQLGDEVAGGPAQGQEAMQQPDQPSNQGRQGQPGQQGQQAQEGPPGDGGRPGEQADAGQQTEPGQQGRPGDQAQQSEPGPEGPPGQGQGEQPQSQDGQVAQGQPGQPGERGTEGQPGQQGQSQQGRGREEQSMTTEVARALANAAAQMQQAARMLEAGADSREVAAVQQQVQAALQAASQAVLASMESTRDQNRGGGGSGSGASAELADEALPEAVMLIGDDWGNLPGKVKNQILQAMSEGYPKEFEEMVQIYFRGLAEIAGNDEK